MEKKFTIRTMTIEDYDGLYALWMTIKGFGIRSIDDSKGRCGQIPEAKSFYQCCGSIGKLEKSWEASSADMTDGGAVCTCVRKGRLQKAWDRQGHGGLLHAGAAGRRDQQGKPHRLYGK